MIEISNIKPTVCPRRLAQFLQYTQHKKIDSAFWTHSMYNNFQAMNSLGCFKDKEKLKTELLKPDHNTGKKKHRNE